MNRANDSTRANRAFKGLVLFSHDCQIHMPLLVARDGFGRMVNFSLFQLGTKQPRKKG